MPARGLKPATTITEYRGTTFELVEVDVETYDRCLKKATNTVEDPMTGQDREEVDENLALRFLLQESLKRPTITEWKTVPTRLMRQLERDVRELHFGAEPKAKKDDDEKSGDDGSPNEEG